MEIKYGEGIEFEVEGENGKKNRNQEAEAAKVSALEDIIRDGYRAPVQTTEKMALRIGDKDYTIFNLGASGIGIYLNKGDEFEINSFLDVMKLTINEKEFQVKGKVVHLSQDESHILCGIELSKGNDDCKKELAAYLERTRNTLFP